MGKKLKEENMRVIEENNRYVICLSYRPVMSLFGSIDGPKIIIKKEKKKRNIIVDFKEGAVSPVYIRMFIRDRKLSYRHYTKSCRIASKYNKKWILQYLSSVGKFEKKDIMAYERAIEISEAVYRGKVIEGTIKKDTYLGQ